MKTKKEYNRPQIEVLDLELEEAIVAGSDLRSSFSNDKTGVDLVETSSFWSKSNIMKGDED